MSITTSYDYQQNRSLLTKNDLDPISDNLLYQCLRTSYSRIYDLYFTISSLKKDIQGSTSELPFPVLLLPKNTSLKCLCMNLSLLETHILLPLDIEGYYVNLIGHGLFIHGSSVVGVLGFKEPNVRRRIIHKEHIDKNIERYTALWIEAPLPDTWFQERNPSNNSLVYQPVENLLLDQYAETKGKDIVCSFKVKDTVDHWRSKFAAFGFVLTRVVEQLDKTLVYVPGHEMDIATKYKTVVNALLLPTLYDTSLGGVGGLTFPSLSKQFSLEDNLKQNGSKIIMTPRQDNRDEVAEILERYLYLQFHTSLWASLITAYDEANNAVDFYRATILNEQRLQLDSRFVKPITDSDQTDLSLLGDSPSIPQTGPVTITDLEEHNIPTRTIFDFDQRKHALIRWLTLRKINNGLYLLDFIEKNDCIRHFDEINSFILPHEKLNVLRNIIETLTRIIDRIFYNDLVALPKPFYSTECCFTPMSICLLILLVLSDTPYIASHVIHMKMVINHTKEDILSRSLNYFYLCINQILQQLELCSP